MSQYGEEKYNLRSFKSDGVQAPILMHLSEDHDFLTNLLDDSPAHAQQDTDSNSSGSDLDGSALVNSSDSDDAGTQPRSFDRLATEGPSTSANKHTTSDAQALINQTILQQLSAIGKCLNKIEQKSVKKTSGPHKSRSKSSGTKTTNVVKQSVSTQPSNHSGRMHTQMADTHTVPSTASLPTLDHLKANHNIQQAVAERLSELQHSNSTGISQKFRSQRRGVEVFVKQKVRWPHEYVLAGSNKECVTYDKLTMGQWMAGFCRAMREEIDQNFKTAMLDYLISLLDDCNDFSWSSAKASHAVLLCHMEQGEIKDYTETDKIDRVRHAHAQRHTSSSQDTSKHALKHNNTRSIVCQYYNAGTCSQQNSHETKGVTYRHVCSFCFSKKWKKFSTH